jgi:hypothetical protein
MRKKAGKRRTLSPSGSRLTFLTAANSPVFVDLTSRTCPVRDQARVYQSSSPLTKESRTKDEREEKTHRSSPVPDSPRSSTTPTAYPPSSPVHPRPPSPSSSSTPPQRPPAEVHLELLDGLEEGSGTSLAAEGWRSIEGRLGVCRRRCRRHPEL